MTEQPAQSYRSADGATFAFIPYSPFWSLIIIALDLFIVWALTAHGRDIVRFRGLTSDG